MDLTEALFIAQHNWAFADSTLETAYSTLHAANTGQANDAAHKIAATLQAREDARDPRPMNIDQLHEALEAGIKDLEAKRPPTT